MLKRWPTACVFVIVVTAAACSGARFEADMGSGGAGGSGTAGSNGSGGTRNSGGSTGKGGSGSGGSASGSGGSISGSCELGAACGPEGSSCNDGSCCPCVYECRSGKWEISGCADCALSSCPIDPPQDGQSCGNCVDPVGVQCNWERCDTEGTSYSATCDGATWSVQVGVCPGDGCCMGNDECASSICVNGVCKEPVQDGCWRDEDCGPDSICSGAMVCSCNGDCAFADVPGACFPADAGCCREASDCEVQCVAGMCKGPLTEPGSCWTDRDCLAPATCHGAQVCACGTSCAMPDTLGVCD